MQDNGSMVKEGEPYVELEATFEIQQKHAETHVLNHLKMPQRYTRSAALTITGIVHSPSFISLVRPMQGNEDDHAHQGTILQLSTKMLNDVDGFTVLPFYEVFSGHLPAASSCTLQGHGHGQSEPPPWSW